MNPTDHLTLSALHHFADSQGCVTESVRTIGAWSGRSAPAVASSLKRLVDYGLIERLPKVSMRSIGRFKIIEDSRVDNSRHNRGRGFTNIQPLAADAQGLPDVFRSPALRTAGVLHRAAVKGQETTVGELLRLGVVRTAKTMRKVLGQLTDLPSPLATAHPDPAHAQRVLWIIHPLTDAAATINLAYLNKLPGAEPKTRAMHEQENAAASGNYMRWFGGHRDMTLAYDNDIAPFVVPDPNNLGCEIWTGEVNGAGYGMPYAGRPYLTAHRMSWLNHVGYLAPGHALHHTCGNRRCAYVGHLVPMSPEHHRSLHSNERTF